MINVCLTYKNANIQALQYVVLFKDITLFSPVKRYIEYDCRRNLHSSVEEKVEEGIPSERRGSEVETEVAECCSEPEVRDMTSHLVGQI